MDIIHRLGDWLSTAWYYIYIYPQEKQAELIREANLRRADKLRAYLAEVDALAMKNLENPLVGRVSDDFLRYRARLIRDIDRLTRN